MHAPGYRRNPHARIFAVADQNPETARRRAQEWGADSHTTDYRELLANPAIGAVEILTPHHLHLEMVLAAIQAGKHVSVQKPMAMNLSECRMMIRAAHKAQVFLRVYENFIFYPPYLKLKELMAEGAIGDPLSLRLRLGSGSGGWAVPLAAWFWRLQEHACGGGPTLFDDGYHKFSMAVDLFGPVAEVKARVRYTLGVIDSPAAVLFKFENGRAGVFETGISLGMQIASDQYGADEWVEVTGTEGSLRMARCTARHGDPPTLILRRRGQSHVFHHLPCHWQDSFSGATRHFIQCLREGAQPRLSGEEGMAVQALAEAAYASSKREGEAVSMKRFMKEAVKA